MSKQGSDSTRRVFSPEEVNACLHFIKLPKPVVSNAFCPTIEWWPCLVFSNIVELKAITQQLGLLSSLLMREITMLYTQTYPASASCRVALLMGEQTPSGNSVVQFDFHNESTSSAAVSSFIVEPFDENSFEFGLLYAQSKEYVNAVQQTLPVLQDVSQSLRRNTNVDTTRGENCEMLSNNLALAPHTEENQIGTPQVDVLLPKNASSYNTKTEMADDNTGTDLRSSPIFEINEEDKSDFSSQESENANAIAPSSLSNALPDHARKETTCNSKVPPISKNVEFVDIPTFKEVKGVLIKGGYTFKGNKFRRPPTILNVTDGNSKGTMPNRCFSSVNALRNDLCVRGVNCRCGTSMDEEKACQCWTEEEKWKIMLWVRYNVIRGPIHVSSPVQVIPSLHQAIKYLIRIGYNRRQLTSPLITYEQQNDLFRHLSQYGLPMEGDEHAACCDYNAISQDERFSLEYFISTNHFRVKTFTFIFAPIVASPPTVTMEIDSPTPSSVVRPKRSVTIRQQRDHDSAKKQKIMNDGGATIVSVESNLSGISKSDTPRKSEVKKNLKRKPSETPRDRKAGSNESQPSLPTGVTSYRSPVLRSSMSLTKEDTSIAMRLPQQRVSLSPIFPPVEIEEVPVPAFEGSDQQKLLSCLDALKLSNCSNLPTICPSNETIEKKSKFAMNIRKVSTFLQEVLMSRGRTGSRTMDDESSAALYVCGAPGLGKTSGVRFCCNYIAKSTLDNDVTIKICHLNASYLTAQSKPMLLVLKELATCIGIKSPCPSESTITKKICDRKSSAVLIVVVDEVDAFVTGSGRTTYGTECLQTLLRWANNPKMQMGLIGISNCMNDMKTSDILELGKFADIVIFSPYSEYELQQILQARVGATVIAPNVIDYIAKKVATSTGDARKALEMAANAVQHRIDQFQGRASLSTPGHLVKMPNVIQANKEEILNLRDRIAGLPAVGKVILCVLTSYAQAGGAIKTTIGELKQCVSECMRQTGMEDEMVQMDDFLVLLETLVDSGLLRASLSTASTGSGNGLNLSQRTLSDVHRQPIYLGIQLDDIEKVLESDLTQTFYQNLRGRARSRRQDE